MDTQEGKIIQTEEITEDDFENPISAHHKGKSSQKQLHNRTKSPETDSSDEDNKLVVAYEEINIRDSVTEGSFLPFTCFVYSKRQFPINEYIFDPQQGAKLVHYLGHYGKIKVLKTFIDKFGLELTTEDDHGSTIAQYAARKGELGMLKYLHELGLDLTKGNKFNIAPVIYAMMHQKVYSFIFLYFKLGCDIDESMLQWAIAEMVKQSPQTEIIQLLLHVKELQKTVLNTALAHSIQSGNMPVLKAILRQSGQTEEQVPLQTLNTLEYQINQATTLENKQEILKFLSKHIRKRQLQKRGLIKTMCSTGVFDKQTRHLVLKRIAGVLSFTGFYYMHILFLATVIYAKGQLDVFLPESFSAFQSGSPTAPPKLSQLTTDYTFVTTAILAIQCVALLLCALTTQPGYVPKSKLSNNQNVVTRLCQEMDNRDVAALTQMDELCLECLTIKFVHLEHCKRCGQCVRHFHAHSKTYNKCFGDANIRPYVLHLLLSLVLGCLYIYQIVAVHWTDLKSSHFVLNVLEAHLKMNYIVMSGTILIYLMTMHTLNKNLSAFTAIAAGWTINEFENSWEYKYLYDVKEIKSAFLKHDHQHYYKRVGFFRSIFNIFAFFCSCRQTKLRLQRNSKKVEANGDLLPQSDISPLKATDSSAMDIELQSFK